MWQRLYDQHPVGLNHDIIGIEDLQVTNMLKNERLAKAISEVS
ncbi:hypothetical protein J2Z23_003309 [Lederbergia galactosidilyticus]|nr:hypothetical protein [Lederbergia galactosidilytica]